MAGLELEYTKGKTVSNSLNDLLKMETKAPKSKMSKTGRGPIAVDTMEQGRARPEYPRAGKGW